MAKRKRKHVYRPPKQATYRWQVAEAERRMQLEAPRTPSLLNLGVLVLLGLGIVMTALRALATHLDPMGYPSDGPAIRHCVALSLTCAVALAGFLWYRRRTL